MNDKEHMEHFYKEKDKILGLHISSQLERDKTILSLSTFSLTILAGFGDRLMSMNKYLSVAIIILLMITIIAQIAGFFVTSKNALAAAENMDNNVVSGRRFFDPGYAKTEWTGLIKVINTAVVSCFLAGFVCLAILMIQGVISA